MTKASENCLQVLIGRVLKVREGWCPFYEPDILTPVGAVILFPFARVLRALYTLGVVLNFLLFK